MEALANACNSVTTLWSKFITKIGCIVICHSPEAPDELFK